MKTRLGLALLLIGFWASAQAQSAQQWEKMTGDNTHPFDWYIGDVRRNGDLLTYTRKDVPYRENGELDYGLIDYEINCRLRTVRITDIRNNYSDGFTKSIRTDYDEDPIIPDSSAEVMYDAYCKPAMPLMRENRWTPIGSGVFVDKNTFEQDGSSDYWYAWFRYRYPDGKQKEMLSRFRTRPCDGKGIVKSYIIRAHDGSLITYETEAATLSMLRRLFFMDAHDPPELGTIRRAAGTYLCKRSKDGTWPPGSKNKANPLR